MLVGSSVLFAAATFSSMVRSGESAESEVRTARPEPAAAQAAPANTQRSTEAMTAPLQTEASAATTLPLTGSAQGCDELHRFEDADGDTWGECVPDLEGAHTRSQAIISFLGLQELTCLTDRVTAATTCEALTPEGAVRTVVVEMTGDISSNVETRPAPTTTTAPPPLPIVPPAPVPFADAGRGCDPNYSGCVPIDSDVDCAGGSGNGPSYVRGPVTVIGVDIYGLDGNDNDGIGCE